MECTVEDVLKLYETQTGHCVSKEVVQLFCLHIQQVKKSYEQGYNDGQINVRQNS